MASGSFGFPFWNLDSQRIVHTAGHSAGEILTGKYTLTEAGAAAAFYTILVPLVIYRSITLQILPTLLIRTRKITGAAMLVVGSASLLNLVFIKDGLQVRLAELLTQLPSESYILLVMLVVIILLGCFMECRPALLMTVPIFLPVVTAARTISPV